VYVVGYTTPEEQTMSNRSTNQEAVTAYNEKLDAAITNLEAVLKALKKKRRTKAETINWGHVGDVGQAFKLAAEMRESLSIE
jgi:hypothetical protein